MQFCLPLYIQHSMPSTQKALCKCSLSEQARWSARGHIYAWEQVVEKCSFSTTNFLPFCSFKSNDLKCILKPSQGANTVSVQFSRSVLTLCDPMDCSTPGFPVHHQFPEHAQTPVHRIGDDVQLSHPRSSPFPPAFNLSQHQGLFQWVSSSHQVAKVLEVQLQHQVFQWTFRTDFL